MNHNIFDITFIASQGDEYLYKAEVNPHHDVFRGHFPDMAVVPGVMTMEMVKNCAADVMQQPLTFQKIKECKFVQAILPNTHSVVEVQLVLKKETAPYGITAQVRYEGEVMVKLKGELIPA